jgi:hypothetical protein
MNWMLLQIGNMNTNTNKKTILIQKGNLPKQNKNKFIMKWFKVKLPELLKQFMKGLISISDKLNS